MASNDTSCASFDPSVETITEFLQRFSMQNIDILHKVRSDPKRKAGVLLKALPVSIVTDLQRKISPVLLSDADYDSLEAALISKYEVKKSYVGAAVSFFKYKQIQGQSIEQFSQQLNFLASKCGFDTQCTLDRLLRDVFISGLNSPAVLSTVLQSADKMNYAEAVDKAKLVQQLRQDATSMSTNATSPYNESAYQLSDDPSPSLDSNEYHEVNKLHQKKPPPSYVCM